MAWMILVLCWSCSTPLPELDKVYLRLGTDVARINPLISGEAYARQVEELIYQPLYQFNNDGSRLIPVLAEGNPQRIDDENGSRFIFKLKPEAKWSDGKSVTAFDFQFTFRQLYNPHLPTGAFKAYLHFLDSIVVHPSRPLEAVVYTNTPYFLAETVLSNIEIFPAHYHDPDQQLKPYTIAQLRTFSKEKGPSTLKLLADNFISIAESGKTIGSGPYTIEMWKRGENVLLKKKENYWGDQFDPKWLLTGKSKWIDFRIIPDIHAAYQSLLAGELDVINEVPDAIFKKACLTSSQLQQCFSPSQYLYYYIGMNRKHAALATPSLRRAVARCLDVDRWIAEQLNELAVRVHNPISPMKPYYLPPENSPFFDPTMAGKTFYTEGGWGLRADHKYRQKTEGTNLIPLKLRYSYVSTNDQAKKLGLFFKEQAAPAGLEIILEPLAFSTLRTRLRSGDFELYYLANYDAPADLDPRQRWHTEAHSSLNYFGFGNVESDRLIEEIGHTLEAEKRAELYKRFQHIIMEDQPCIFLFSPNQKIITRPNIKIQESGLWPGYKAQSVTRLVE